MVMVFSVTYYLELHKVVASRYKFHLLPTKIKGCCDAMNNIMTLCIKKLCFNKRL